MSFGWAPDLNYLTRANDHLEFVFEREAFGEANLTFACKLGYSSDVRIFFSAVAPISGGCSSCCCSRRIGQIAKEFQ